MKIYAKIEKSLNRYSLRATNGMKCVLVDYYWWPYIGQYYVVAAAPGKSLDFMASDFNMAKAIDLLKTYAKAYL